MPFHHTGILKKHGLLNVDAPDLGEMQKETDPSTVVGFCSSTACNRYNNSRWGVPRIFSNAKQGSVCPKCNAKIVSFERYTTKEVKALLERESRKEKKKDQLRAKARARYAKTKQERIDRINQSIK